MASGMTSAKKMVVRTALVTGSTMAVVVGAQSLIGLDLQKATSAQVQNNQIADSPTVAQPPTSVAAPEKTIVSAPPNIVILRHSSEQNSSTTAAQTSNSAPVIHQSVAPVSIQPPNPVAIPQQQMTIQQPSASTMFVPTTRSTR